jgi:hypothetical protein
MTRLTLKMCLKVNGNMGVVVIEVKSDFFPPLCITWMLQVLWHEQVLPIFNFIFTLK